MVLWYGGFAQNALSKVSSDCLLPFTDCNISDILYAKRYIYIYIHTYIYIYIYIYYIYYIYTIYINIYVNIWIICMCIYMYIHVVIYVHFTEGRESSRETNPSDG